MNYKNILLSNILLLNSGLIMCMKKDEKKVQEFIYFNQLPQDIQKEILKFTTGVNPKDLDLESLNKKAPSQILNLLSKIYNLKLVNKKINLLINDVYSKNFKKNESNELIQEKIVQLTLQLRKAIQKEQIDECKKLIIDGAIDFNFNNSSSLLKAFDLNYSNNNFLEIIKLLIETNKKRLSKNDYKEYIEQKDFTGRSVLNASCFLGYTEIIKLLIESNANIDSRDGQFGTTGLRWACERGFKEIVELLIQNEARINLKDKFGNSALMKASEMGHKDIIEMLIKNGAKTDIKNNDGKDAIDLAKNQEIKEFLSKVIKNVNPKKRKIDEVEFKEDNIEYLPEEFIG